MGNYITYPITTSLLLCQLCLTLFWGTSSCCCWFYHYSVIDSIGCLYCFSVVLFSYCILSLCVCLSWFEFASLSHHVSHVVLICIMLVLLFFIFGMVCCVFILVVGSEYWLKWLRNGCWYGCIILFVCLAILIERYKNEKESFKSESLCDVIFFN